MQWSGLRVVGHRGCLVGVASKCLAYHSPKSSWSGLVGAKRAGFKVGWIKAGLISNLN